MTESLEAFARAFFEGEGVAWEAAGDGQFCLTLDGALAAHFGTERLVLGAGGEPLAVGGRVFDAMLAWLGARGRCAALTLPRRELAAPVLRPHGGSAEALGGEPADRRYAVFDFQLAFLTEERREVLWSVALDEEGAVAPGVPERLAAAGEVLDLPTGQVAGVVAELGARLGQAEHLARTRAEVLAGPHEASCGARLAEVCARLTAYYAELEAELPLRRRRGQGLAEAQAEWEAERAALRQDLARRLEAERRRHQLRVLVRAVGFAVLVVPGRLWRWRFQGDGRPREVTAWQDLASGQLAWTACERCGRADGHLGSCAAGHVACPLCLAPCGGCGRQACGPELLPCGDCGLALCGCCRVACVRGHRVCASHLRACACCGSLACGACAAPCPRCLPAEPRWLALGHACPVHGIGGTR